MVHIKKIFVLAVVIGSVLFIRQGYAVSEAEGVQAESELQQVALFKNGLGFFVSAVRCPDEKEFSFVPYAAASHGTFWVSYPAEVKLESLTAKEVEVEKSIEAISMEEFLRANVGKRVELSFDDKGESTIRGILKSFAEDRPEPQPDPYAPGMNDYSNVPRYIRPPVRASLIIMETDVGEVAIDSQKVRRIKFIECEPEETITTKSKSMQIDVRLEKPAGGKKLLVSYLAKGITWAPSYILDISKADKMRISAKAVVINETCELDGVTVQLVTGFPNLQFADVVSPLAKKENLAQFLRALSRGQSEIDEASGILSNAMFQQIGGYGGGMMGGMGGGMMGGDFIPAYGAAEVGMAAEDLFLYPVEGVSLEKGEVGYLPLFTESVPYKHIYKWEILDYVSEEERYSYQRRGQEEGEPNEEVWHCLRVENITKVPWTTAPAEIVKEGIVLGQDTLNYTPAEGETTVKITQAVSVKAEQVEIEIDRKRDAAQLYGYHYDLVTVEGKLSVTNFQQKGITLEISKTLSGELKSSQPEAKVDSLARGLRRMNGVKRLTWTIELKAGESQQLDYTYEVYVRR
ncbi:hypothetical protein ACFL1G_05025 [Planctomycetota bacterium]